MQNEAWPGAAGGTLHPAHACRWAARWELQVQSGLVALVAVWRLAWSLLHRTKQAGMQLRSSASCDTLTICGRIWNASWKKELRIFNLCCFGGLLRNTVLLSVARGGSSGSLDLNSLLQNVWILLPWLSKYQKCYHPFSHFPFSLYHLVSVSHLLVERETNRYFQHHCNINLDLITSNFLKFPFLTFHLR